jgi:23S rRNA (uracil1939-C5)-methyltransferase
VPRVVYVSCAPETLARDLAVLQQGGLGLRSLQGFDMLPQTPHLELVAVLEHRPPARER